MIDGAITGHVWHDDGHDDEGVAVQRCERCAVRSHWPAAQWRCDMYPRRAPRLTLSGPPLHEGQFAAPYVVAPPSRCTVCLRRFRLPLRAPHTVVCSRRCGFLLRNQRVSRARSAGVRD